MRKKILMAVLLLATALYVTACGGGANTTATTMHLKRTEGTVTVSDSAEKDVPLLENLSLYSGYGVDTRTESYAWINLDDVKLTKMDQESVIAIQKEGKTLEIEIISGSLFFNVTQPLEDDETMDIRTSTMLVGIRGTCGWVEEREGFSRVYILEGEVECSAGNQTVQVNAGEMAELTADGDLTVTAMTVQDIPDFVRDDLIQDSGLCNAIYEASGLDVTGTVISDTLAIPETVTEPEGDILASSEAGEGVTYSYYSNGVLTIEGAGPMDDFWNNDTSSVVQPWNDYKDQIHTVIISDGVTSIGSFAFWECSNLTSAIIPGSVISIGEQAFEHCRNLTYVTIPYGVTDIGFAAFYDCKSLTSVAIPDSVTIIEDNAFGACFALTDLTISDNVTYIGEGVFAFCTSLASAVIPDSVTTIGPHLFEGCTSLTSVTIGNVVLASDWYYNTLAYIFADCTSLTTVTIPNGITTIGDGAFYQSGLTSVTIPASVTFIGDDAFEGCDSLTDVYYGGNGSQWKDILIEEYGNDPLFSATIHYADT